MKVYKLFKVKKGKLFPLYIDANNEVPMNVWLEAKEPNMTENGRVKSKLGELAYRPGWHCCEIPFADHIGKKQKDGTHHQKRDTIWCEIEIKGNDYTQLVAKKTPRDSCSKKLLKNGYYWYQTNPNAKVRWLISSDIKINRILSQSEVIEICKAHGVDAQPLSQD